MEKKLLGNPILTWAKTKILFLLETSKGSFSFPLIPSLFNMYKKKKKT